MLKELMHSMSMPMVRDKAVSAFLDRLSPSASGEEVRAGWLELRKEYHTRLLEDGQLVILRPGVLSPLASLARGREKRAEREVDEPAAWSPGLRLPLASLALSHSEPYSIIIGVWMVEIRRARAARAQERALVSLIDLLPGLFSYQLVVAEDDKEALVVWADHLTSSSPLTGRDKANEKEAVKVPAALDRLDPRLRLGLPLLVPVFSSSSTNVIILDLDYRFVDSLVPS